MCFFLYRDHVFQILQSRLLDGIPCLFFPFFIDLKQPRVTITHGLSRSQAAGVQCSTCNGCVLVRSPKFTAFDQSHSSNTFPTLNVIAQAGLDEVVQSERSTLRDCRRTYFDYKSGLTIQLDNFKQKKKP